MALLLQILHVIVCLLLVLMVLLPTSMLPKPEVMEPALRAPTVVTLLRVSRAVSK